MEKKKGKIEKRQSLDSEEEVVKEEELIKEEKEEKQGETQKPTFDVESWKPKTSIGERVKKGEIKDIDEILEKGYKIMEPGIVDVLLPDAEVTLLLIGQSKGKFGGGQRRVFKQTQKKTREGNKPHFATIAVIGDRKGHVGIGYGKSRETVPAREKAVRNAKLNVIKIRRGCGSWSCGCGNAHSIPFKVEGKSGSAVIRLMPAPKGKGLCIEPECGKIVGLAGIKDIWSKTFGQTRTKINLIHACLNALMKLNQTKIQEKHTKALGIVEGSIKTVKEAEA